MKINYHWTTLLCIDKISSQSQYYSTWFNLYWNDCVRDALIKNSVAIRDKADGLRDSFRDIISLNEKFDSCHIEQLIDSAHVNYYNCKKLESEIATFRVKSDAISKV